MLRRRWRQRKPRRLLLAEDKLAHAGNEVLLAGRLLERGAMRYTPAGIPVIEFRLAHASEQIEAGQSRQVECEMPCMALGQMAQLMADSKPGDGLTTKGFLAARSRNSRTLVLHVTQIEFLEGNENGFQT
ncbi:Primosomal replication protein N [Georgfuchsia toluolica]|uniref:Replication restart protein PriB n=2 Tax=Georgfuchsia toluolica TaxID=424218 RepID=A0A916J2D1_9PROT|nr:Primosomal replication protein N [Georgfuchsia toluolica]